MMQNVHDGLPVRHQHSIVIRETEKKVSSENRQCQVRIHKIQSDTLGTEQAFPDAEDQKLQLKAYQKAIAAILNTEELEGNSNLRELVPDAEGEIEERLKSPTEKKTMLPALCTKQVAGQMFKVEEPPSPINDSGNSKKLVMGMLSTDAGSGENKEAASSIEGFTAMYGGPKDMVRIKQWILDGQRLYRDLSNNKLPIKEIIKEWNVQSDVAIRQGQVALVWFLLSKAMVKAQGFRDGAFTLPDPLGRIRDFFLSLGVGCGRSSTHLKGLQEMVVGININDASLPGGLMHILVQTMKGKGRIFLKPEKFGLLERYTAQDFGQLAMHGGDLVLSLGRKVIPSVLGSDDAPENRKERIPVKEGDQFRKLVMGILDGEAAITEVGSGDTGDGIQAMVRYLSSQLSLQKLDPLKREEFERFLNELTQSYDNLEHRIGREIVFTSAELDSDSLELPKEV